MEEKSDIDFRDWKPAVQKPSVANARLGLSGWLIKHSGGLIKDHNRAIIVIITISIIELILAAAIVIWVLF